MSQITYNGVTIYDVQTQSVTETLATDRSNADLIGLKVSLSVTGVIHKDESVTTFGKFVGSPGSDNIALFATNLKLLSVPRRTFRYVIGSTVIWAVMPMTTDTAVHQWNGAYYVSDGILPAIHNGPVTEVQINRVIGGHSAHITFKIDFTFLPCSYADTAVANARLTQNISSFRWWYADDIDCKTWLNTRTMRGRLEILSRSAGRNLAALRYITVPPLQYGWRRDMLSWNESDDGYVLDFTCRDSEIIAAPPFPACEWSGRVSLSAPFAGAGANQARMQCTLTGPKGVKKLELIDLLIRIIDAKLNWLNRVETLEGGDEKGTFCTEFEIEEVIGTMDNTVSANIEIMYTKGYENTELIALIEEIFGFDLTYDPGGGSAADPGGVRPERGLKGYDTQRSYFVTPLPRSFAGWFFAAIQNACTPNTGIAIGASFVPPKPDQPQEPEKPTEDGQKPDDTLPTQGEPPDGGDAGDAPTAVANPPNTPYMAYQITASYKTVEGRGYAGVSGLSSGISGSVIVSRVHKPVTTLTMRFGATRLNKWPKMPRRADWTDPETGIKFYVIEHILSPNAAVPSADGRKVAYSAIAEVTYVLSRPPAPGEKLFVGALPYLDKAKLEGNMSDVLYFDGDGLVTPIDGFDGIPDPGEDGPGTGGDLPPDGGGGGGGGFPGDGFPPNEGDDTPPGSGGGGGADAPPAPIP